MDSLWPWLTIAGLGALHGLNPASGWMFATTWDRQEDGGARTWRALPSLALGHLASITVVAWLLTRGAAMDPSVFRLMAAGLLAVAALHCLLRGARRHRALCREAGPASMALWSFLMASAQGAGMMLTPALAPMCLAGGSARLPGPPLLPLMGLALHLAAMLLTTGLVASGIHRGLARHPHRPGPGTLQRGWPVLLAGTALLLVLSR
ncbi:hypothetical protein [Solimonas sp. SE-A11]|uniref:hypothetical protein n=1 Tax=Solimonas sp. SE-A11 TaxID=3054954 RepID=UPI00259C8A85|nr:hypothetical protein [Solimonas sp. SE-A11]MDM4769210.1 hypothetical protein [Solimonas sp. SE-A11]